MSFTWVNAENPEEQIECAWMGQGLDDGEKGVGKALTYAEKYFLLKFFNIATDKDDPDSFQAKNEESPKNTTAKATTKNDLENTEASEKAATLKAELEKLNDCEIVDLWVSSSLAEINKLPETQKGWIRQAVMDHKKLLKEMASLAKKNQSFADDVPL